MALVERLVRRLLALPAGALRVIGPLQGLLEDLLGLRVWIVAARLLLLGQQFRAAVDVLGRGVVMAHGVRYPKSIRGTIGVGILAGVGLSLVLAGVGSVITKLQLLDVTAEIDRPGGGIGNGSLIVGCVLLALGLTALICADRLRRSIQSWPVAVAFVITANLVSFVSRHFFHALI